MVEDFNLMPTLGIYFIMILIPFFTIFLSKRESYTSKQDKYAEILIQFIHPDLLIGPTN